MASIFGLLARSTVAYLLESAFMTGLPSLALFQFVLFLAPLIDVVLLPQKPVAPTYLRDLLFSSQLYLYAGFMFLPTVAFSLGTTQHRLLSLILARSAAPLMLLVREEYRSRLNVLFSLACFALTYLSVAPLLFNTVIDMESLGVHALLYASTACFVAFSIIEQRVGQMRMETTALAAIVAATNTNFADALQSTKWLECLFVGGVAWFNSRTLCNLKERLDNNAMASVIIMVFLQSVRHALVLSLAMGQYTLALVVCTVIFLCIRMLFAVQNEIDETPTEN